MSHKTEQSRLARITAQTEKRIDKTRALSVAVMLINLPRHLREQFEEHIQARDVDKIGSFVLMQLYQTIQAKVIEELENCHEKI